MHLQQTVNLPSGPASFKLITHQRTFELDSQAV